MRCAIWNFWNFSNLSWRVAYLKLSDETWNEMCYLKFLKLLTPIMEGGLFETFETSETCHGGLLIWNFQMRLEMRCTIWNFWNFSNLSWRVAYLKLSDETWNEMCYLKLLKLLKPIMESCLFETFRWDLKWDVLFETFETSQTYHGGWLIWNFWNFSNLSWRVAYLKLSDEIWNEMCYLKLLKLLKPIMEGGLFETFETFQTYHRELLIWIFQMILEMRCPILNFWNFSNLSWRVAYLNLSDGTWNEMYYMKLLKPIMEGCLFETFWNFSNLSCRVAYLKLSDETWNEMCYLKLLKPIMEGGLFETF